MRFKPHKSNKSIVLCQKTKHKKTFTGEKLTQIISIHVRTGVRQKVLGRNGDHAEEENASEDRAGSRHLVGDHSDGGNEEGGEEAFEEEDEAGLLGGETEVLVEERSVGQHAEGACESF